MHYQQIGKQQLVYFMSSLTKSFSTQQRKKQNSQTKLPKIDKIPRSNQQKIRIKEIEKSSKNLANVPPSLEILNLFGRRGNSISDAQKNKKAKQLTQESEQLQVRRSNKSTVKLKPIGQQQAIADSKQKSSKQKIVQDSIAGSDAISQSGRSSTSLHPVVSQIQTLISEETKNLLMPVKSYSQNLLGQVSSIWWCVVDSIFLSLIKVIRIKQVVLPLQKDNKGAQKSGARDSPGKGERKKQVGDKTVKKLSGNVQSNIKATIQMSKVYCNLEEENKKNEETVLKYYQDPNHLALIIQAFFYEKSIIYLIGTIKKWSHSEQLLCIHSLALQLIPCVIQCRKLIIQILIEAVENEQQDNKIRKPKYIARQKKLIQISKFTTMIKNQYEKYMNSLGSPHRYKSFYIPESLREHGVLLNLQQKWRNMIFDIHIAPFLSEKPNRKEYLAVIEPLNFLYKYNKKQESIQIEPYAEHFMKCIGQHFDILLFTYAQKQSSLLNFLGILDKAQILGVLDKQYLTYQQAKPVKNISKLGGGYDIKKILIIDDKLNSKYYPTGIKSSLLLVEGYNVQAKITRINGKLVRMDEHDEDYLKNLARKITQCSQKGGNWSQLINEKHERKK